MIWLALDGALGAFSAALAFGDGRAPRVAGSGMHEALERGLAVIDEVLLDVAPADVTALAVGTGPGGFTGLRIALSYAKSLAFAWQKPLVGVPSYDALEPPDAIAPCATYVVGRPGIGCMRLRMDGDVLFACGPHDVLSDALAARLEPGTMLHAYGLPEGVASALGERGITVHALATNLDSPALAIAKRAMVTREFQPAHAIRADYGEAHYAERPQGGRGAYRRP